MKRFAVPLAAVMLLSQCAVVCAGESADLAAKTITDRYYPALTADQAARINALAAGGGSDHEKIAQMCGLLDAYSEYLPYGAGAASETPYEYAVNGGLYVKITQFAFGVDDGVLALLEEYPGIPLLLDLTECSGGVTTVAEHIAQAIVPAGLLCTIKFKDAEQRYVSEFDGAGRTVVTLISNATASAAELLAAALQESGAGIVVGRQSRGKASVQTARLLPNGGILKITSGHWFTRNGADIDGIGIAPNITVDGECLKAVLPCVQNIAVTYFKAVWRLRG
ncbi:MAG: S41 family peptidase [Clostridiales bacterium]|jgi:hypothetical protein|nr:S41 family peptidase [Clostridiales bacterium]